MGRRKKGSAYPDKHGQWWAQIRLSPGKYRRARCDSRKDAERTVEKWIKEQEAGANLRTARLSLHAWCEKWASDLAEAEEVTRRTLEFYTRHVGYAMPHMGHLALEDVEPQHWRDARPKLLKAGLNRTSVNHIHSVLHNALERAVQDGAILSNPMKLVKRLPAGKNAFQARVLTPEEIAALEHACEGERFGTLLLFILAHGVRNSEARNLKRSDVDLEQRRFFVKDSKTRSGVRRIDLTDYWVEHLRAQFALVDEEREIARRRDVERAKQDAQLAPGKPTPLRRIYRDHGLVFPSEVGTVQTEANVNRTKQRILKKAGLCDPCLDCGQTGKVPGKDGKPAKCKPCLGRGVLLWPIRIHDLRHTAITDWIAEGGADPKTAQGMAGHSSASTTMEIYAKTRDNKQRDVLERVEQKRRKKAESE